MCPCGDRMASVFGHDSPKCTKHPNALQWSTMQNEALIYKGKEISFFFISFSPLSCCYCFYSRRTGAWMEGMIPPLQYTAATPVVKVCYLFVCSVWASAAPPPQTHSSARPGNNQSRVTEAWRRGAYERWRAGKLPKGINSVCFLPPLKKCL